MFDSKPVMTSSTEVELLTFRVGKLLCGVDIREVKEIKSQLTLTRAPHAAKYVLGVMNLRSDVITVLDLGRLLRITPPGATAGDRGVIVGFHGELIALAVNAVAEVHAVSTDNISPLPPNFRRKHDRAFLGVCSPAEELVFVLDFEEALKTRPAKLLARTV